MSTDAYVVCASFLYGAIKAHLDTLSPAKAVTLLGVGGHGGKSKEDVINLLKAEQAPAAFVGLSKNFIRRCGYSPNNNSVKRLHGVTPDDLALLTAWLIPKTELKTPEYPEPVVMWESVRDLAPDLLFADSALAQANEIGENCREWLSRAIDSCCALSNGKSGGKDFDKFFKESGVAFAGTCELTRFNCTVLDRNGKELKVVKGVTTHLKKVVPRAGAADVPRIYFAWFRFKGSKFYLAILYCGPHPAEHKAVRSVTVTMPV